MNEEQNSILMQHLMFHKAIIDDEKESSNIDRYLKILNENPDCERMQDPLDESIRSVFSLVLEQDFDPWAIDLDRFVKTYSEKVDGTNSVDLIVAGRLILMAWKVLRRQAEATRELYDTPEEIEEVFDEEFDTGLYVPQTSIRETYSRSPKRPVTMLELLDAFAEASEQIEEAKRREEERKNLKKEKRVERFDNKAHQEVTENDVEDVWKRIQKIGTGAFSMTELFNSDIDSNITVFLSALQLVKDGRLSIWQDSLPHGDIMMEIKVDWMSGRLEDAEETVKVAEAVTE